MYRDFSDEAKEQLLGYVEDTAQEGFWDGIADAIGDFGLTVWDWMGQLDISKYVDEVEKYHKKIIDKENTTKEQIEQIFSDVKDVDTHYAETLGEALDVGKQIIAYMGKVSDIIDPSAGKFDATMIEEILGAAQTALGNEQVGLASALTGQELIQAATTYVENVAYTDITYDEYIMLSAEEQQRYLNSLGKYILALHPTVELEAGKYEIKVPFGVDMMVTYCVSVTGTINTENESTVALTIEEQKLVLDSFALQGDVASVEVSSDGIETGVEMDGVEVYIGYEEDGSVELTAMITTGESETSFSVGETTGVTSFKYEVETTISEELAVTSSLELEKANNTDMPQWEPVEVLESAYVEDEGWNIDIDEEKVMEGVCIAAVSILVYEGIKWGVAAALAPCTGGASLAAAAALP